jgi:cytoskeletal protein CcmA (bactofilin family)
MRKNRRFFEKKTMKEPLNYIAPDVEFEGKIDCEGSIRIDGTCRGVIDSKDSITIGNSARVFGTVRAQNLIVNGRVEGDLITNGRIAVLSEGEIEGEIFTPPGCLFVARGGVFQGGLRTEKPPELPSSEKLLALHESSGNDFS